MSDITPNPAPNPAPEWKTLAPQFESEVALANGFKSTQAELTRARQELAALKSAQPNPQPTPTAAEFDFTDPNRFFKPDEGFTDEFVNHLETTAKVPKQLAKELGDTIREARQIIAKNNETEFNKFAGFDNARTALTTYLSQTYQGADLQDRLNDLNGKYWKTAARATLEEMKEKNFQMPKPGAGEPSPLPTVSPQFSTLTPLEPGSKEAVAAMSDPKYWEDAAYNNEVVQRIALWQKMNAKR